MPIGVRRKATEWKKVENLYRTALAQNDSNNPSEQIRSRFRDSFDRGIVETAARSVNVRKIRLRTPPRRDTGRARVGRQKDAGLMACRPVPARSVQAARTSEACRGAPFAGSQPLPEMSLFAAEF